MINSLPSLTDKQIYDDEELQEIQLIQEFKAVPDCVVMKHGVKKIPMDVFYCSCDKEHKFTICRACMKTCHSTHEKCDFTQIDPGLLWTCMCGVKNHHINDEKKDTRNKNIKCMFHELSGLSQNFDIYNGQGINICIFCKMFCSRKSPDSEELTKTSLTKNALSKDEWEDKTNKFQIKCNCPELNGSAHKLSSSLSNFINEFNIPRPDYFKGLSSTHLMNLLFHADNLFNYLYSGFLAEHNKLKDFKLEKRMPSTDLYHWYINFSFNARNCKCHFYFSEKIRRFYPVSFARELLDKRFEDHPNVYKFYSGFLLGFKKFRIAHDLESLPKFKIVDFANMNQFQRLIVSKTALNMNRNLDEYKFDEDLKKCQLVDFCISFLEKIVRLRLDCFEVIAVFVQISAIIKKFAKFYLISSDQMQKYSKSVDECFYFVPFFNKKLLKKGKVRDMETRMKLVKVTTNFIKALIYFSLNYNDQNIIWHLQRKSHAFFAFFHRYNDLGQVITKNLIHLVNYLTDELEDIRVKENIRRRGGVKKEAFVSILLEGKINEDEEGRNGFGESDFGREFGEREKLRLYKEKIKKVLLISSNLISMCLHHNDIYITSLKRSINNNLSLMIKLSHLTLLPDPEEQNFINFLNKEHFSIEESYNIYFTSPILKIASLCNKILESTENFLSRTNMSDFQLPSDRQNGGSLSVDVIKESEEELTARQQLMQKSQDDERDIKDKSFVDTPRGLKRKNTCQPIPYAVLMSKSNYIFSLTKVFAMNEDKMVYSFNLVENVIRILFIFIQGTPDNCIVGLSDPILANLSHIPPKYIDKVLDYMIEALRIIAKTNYEICYTYQFIKYAVKLFQKANKLPNKVTCLDRLLKIFKFVSMIPVSNKTQLILIFRKELRDLYKKATVISDYKSYLLQIAEDYLHNSKFYHDSREFDNEEIFQNCFRENFPQMEALKMGIAFKIYLKFIKQMNFSFDDNALSNHSDMLKTVLNSKEIIQMLKIKTLHISLRTELIKFFRMVYIDMSIDMEMIQEYRCRFKSDLESEVWKNGESLIPKEDMKIFCFLEMLMQISGMDETNTEEKDAYKMLLYEIKNISDIIDLSKPYDNDVYVNYIENGILLPVKVYLNKIFSIVMTMSGRDFLRIYTLCNYLLVMKKFILRRNFFNHEDITASPVFNFLNIPNSKNITASFNLNANANNNKPSDELKKTSVIISKKLHIEKMKEVDDDLRLISSKRFQPLNYLHVYEIINRNIMSLIQNPTSKELVDYFSSYEEYHDEELNDFTNTLKNRGIKCNTTEEKLMLAMVKEYVEQKQDFDNSAIKVNLNENDADLETNFRTILVKFLFFLSSQKIFKESFYAKESNEILLHLLKKETKETQDSIWGLYKLDKLEKDKLQVIPSRVPNVNISYLSECGFQNILSIIFSQYNPTTIKITDDYYNACHIIKVFKYLCEDHNKDFQYVFLKKVSFPFEENKKVTFYDMMIYILDKIITLAGWEKVKKDEGGIDYFYGLFSCIIEMLIEMVQGTAPENFSSLYVEESEEDDEDDEEAMNLDNPQTKKTKPLNCIKDDPILEEGKALPLFLSNIKCILFNDISNSETIYKVRKELVDFLLAFLEEYACPNGIKKMIIGSFHPIKIIKSIHTILRKFYLAQEFDPEPSNNNNENQKPRWSIASIQNDDNHGSRKRSLNMIIDSHFSMSSHVMLKKWKDKRLKRVKFNEGLYEYFSYLYENDSKFPNTPEFSLCIAFYNYFKLTRLQFQYDESVKYWRKINSIPASALAEFNIRTKDAELEDSKDKPVQDETDFEAFYVFKLFEKISQSVLVKIPSSKTPVVVVYSISPYLKYLSINSKEEFLRTVNRSDRYSKLYSLVEQTEFFRLEIEYNWNNLRNSGLLKKTNQLNYRMISIIMFIIALILNICLLAVLHESGLSSIGNDSLQNIRTASFALVGIDCILILIWCVTKMPLYYVLQKSKYKEAHSKNNMSQLEDKDLTCLDKLSIGCKTIVMQGEITTLIFFLVFILVGACQEDLTFLYSITLLSVVSLSRTLNNIALSIVLKYRQLLWTMIFTVIILYVWSAWGFYFEINRFYDIHERVIPEQTCSTLGACWLTVMNHGLRWHAGIGKILPNESLYISPGNYFLRWFYDFIFFLIVIIIMLHIVFGIILDTFRELRKKENEIEQDITNKCFICNLQKDECEKNNQNFKEHCETVHNVWDYANYMITLRMRDRHELNSINSYCRSQITEKKIKWIPDKIDELSGEQDEEKISVKEE